MISIPEFIKKYPEYLAKDNAMGFLSADGGETYTRCHCMLPVANPSAITHEALSKSGVTSKLETLTFGGVRRI